MELLSYASSSSDPEFCTPPDATPLRAVLGVLTTERTRWRDSARHSFLQFVEPGVVMRIVLRGINASAAVRNESSVYADTVFLKAPALLGAGRGPLTSTLLWLRCASSAWPHADFIGKAEDDTWVHVPDVLDSLMAARDALALLGISDIYWGMHESYLWNETAQRPLGFGHNFPFSMWEQPCTKNASGNISRSSGQLSLGLWGQHHGPFSCARIGTWHICSHPTGNWYPLTCLHERMSTVAKGPLYFLSQPLAARLSADTSTLMRADAALATTDEHRSGGHRGVPRHAEKLVWEDVWMGYALSMLEPAPSLGLVTISWNLYFEEWGFGVTPTALLWHAKTKEPSRPPVLHSFMALTRKRCGRTAPRCRDGRTDGRLAGGSCMGAKWVFCQQDAAAQCRGAKVDLNKVWPGRQQELHTYGLRLVPNEKAADELPQGRGPRR